MNPLQEKYARIMHALLDVDVMDYALVLIEKLNWTFDPHKKDTEVEMFNEIT